MEFFFKEPYCQGTIKIIKLHLNQDMVRNTLDASPILPSSYHPEDQGLSIPLQNPKFHSLGHKYSGSLAKVRVKASTGSIFNDVEMMREGKEKKTFVESVQHTLAGGTHSGCFLSKADAPQSVHGKNASKHLQGFPKPCHLH